MRRYGSMVGENFVIEDEKFRFGLASRPSTPMYGVMNNVYGRVAAEVQNAVYKRPPTSKNETSISRFTEPRSTKAATLL
jgi:hypothetical protein